MQIILRYNSPDSIIILRKPYFQIVDMLERHFAGGGCGKSDALELSSGLGLFISSAKRS